MATVDEALERYGSALRACRRALLRDLAGAPCERELREHFARGKLIRPLVALASTSAVGGDPDRALAAAQAIELLHGASLIHDDIIDAAEQRRGLPALHVRLGADVALGVGDYLQMRAFSALAIARDSHPAERVLAAIDALARYAQACCRGEVEELLRREAGDPEVAYLAIVRAKTASQFAAAASVAAILAGARREQVAALEVFGLSAGTAFQIRDDVLDIVGETRRLGKPAGNSLALGRPTLPLIYLEHYGSRAARAEYHRLLSDGRDRRAIAALLDREGLLERIDAVQNGCVQEAILALEPLPHSSGRATLEAVARLAAVHDA
jgi:geranylgeranyl pyrophosphate synthase